MINSHVDFFVYSAPAITTYSPLFVDYDVTYHFPFRAGIKLLSFTDLVRPFNGEVKNGRIYLFGSFELWAF